MINKRLLNLDKEIDRKEYQYRYDIFDKLDFDFKERKKILDVGCGPCITAKVFRDVYNLDVVASDVYEHENVKKFGLNFVLASITNLPFPDSSFDYVFAQDVLHHVDEKDQSHNIHIKSLEETKRVVKNGGYVILVEANRYNPLLYPHMTGLLGHQHFRQSYFIRIVRRVFKSSVFKFKEIHNYNSRILWFWKLYERFMENVVPIQFRSYNIAILEVKK